MKSSTKKTRSSHTSGKKKKELQPQLFLFDRQGRAIDKDDIEYIIFNNMSRLDYEIEIPFAENTGRRCVPACTEMIANYLFPAQLTTRDAAEALSGFREDRATWATQHLLSLNDQGVEVGWIQNEDITAFAANPEEYIKSQFRLPSGELSIDAYVAFLRSNDIAAEAARIQAYLEANLPFEQRQATTDDITRRMIGGYIVRLEVNGKRLANQPGFVNHAVVVSGFSDSVVRLENPDGQHGAKPKQVIPWDVLDAAWPEERALQYYRVSL